MPHFQGTFVAQKRLGFNSQLTTRENDETRSDDMTDSEEFLSGFKPSHFRTLLLFEVLFSIVYFISNLLVMIFPPMPFPSA